MNMKHKKIFYACLAIMLIQTALICGLVFETDHLNDKTSTWTAQVNEMREIDTLTFVQLNGVEALPSYYGFGSRADYDKTLASEKVAVEKSLFGTPAAMTNIKKTIHCLIELLPLCSFALIWLVCIAVKPSNDARPESPLH